jgi:heme-degrading monooxygenase HmoA
MTIIKTEIFILLVGITLCLIACGSNPSDNEVEITQLPDNQEDSSNLQTLTITKVKKPWYASRGMVVSRMRKSIPEYQAIKGLKNKYYSFTENHKLFGGIYFWETEKDAKTWFDKAWFERTEKKYGQKGIVEYYQILNIQNIAKTSQNEGKFWAVLSFSTKKSEIDENADGLIKIIQLKNEKAETGFLTLWQSKASTEKYFAQSKYANTFFDTPILLDNSKITQK